MIFNIDEVFRIAVQIETNGVKFYTKAAMSSTEPKVKQYFMELADMEKDHIKIFSEMRKELIKKEKEESFLDPFDEAKSYLRAFIEGKIFSLNDDPAEKLTGHESYKDILGIAINLEKESIVFYLGIKKMIPEEYGQDKISKILDEEMQHIALLSKGII